VSEKRATEALHPLADALDRASLAVWLEAMHADSTRVFSAVRAALPNITMLTATAAQQLGAGGRVILVGAGTSGRLAALEAAECPPTFGTHSDQIVALVAGGAQALTHAIEGAEDDADAGARELAALHIDPTDLVVGVSASGSTPYVLGALIAARATGAATAAIVCNVTSALGDAADLRVALLTGPEFVAGSTRLKAASAQKLALNLMTTGALRQLGRVRRGRMSALRATNAKLRQRAIQIVSDLAGLSPSAARRALDAADGDVAQALAALPRVEPRSRTPVGLEIELRRLTARDAESVTALAEQHRVIATTAPFTTLGGDVFSRWLERPGLMLGAWRDTRLAGVILVERSNTLLRAHVADIGYVAVSDSARGLGIGDLLVGATLDWARAEGVLRVELRVWPANIGAVRLYERHGFVLEGRLRAHAQLGDRLVDALLMAWTASEIESYDNWT
jgi:N-acetylmuramic acid 6-phosphate etherase